MAGGRESGRRERRASSRPPPPTRRPAQGEAGTPSNAHGPTARVFLRAPHPAAWEPEKEPDAPRPGRQRGRQLRAGGPPPGRATQAAAAAARKRRRRRRVCALASPVGSLRPAHPGMDRQPLSTPGDTDTEARCPTTTTLPLKKHKNSPHAPSTPRHDGRPSAGTGARETAARGAEIRLGRVTRREVMEKDMMAGWGGKACAGGTPAKRK